MRRPLDDREPGIEGRPEERGADLAHTAAHTLDRPAAVDDEGFCKPVLKADIPHVRAH